MVFNGPRAMFNFNDDLLGGIYDHVADKGECCSKDWERGVSGAASAVPPFRSSAALAEA